MYVTGFTNPKDVIFDIARELCTANNLHEEDLHNNWELIFPNMDDLLTPDFTSYPQWHTGSLNRDDMTRFINLWQKPEQGDIPTRGTQLYSRISDPTNPTVVLKCHGRLTREWTQISVTLDASHTGNEIPDPHYTGSGTPPMITAMRTETQGGREFTVINLAALDNSRLAYPNGEIRINVRGQRYSFYRVDAIDKIGVQDFYIEAGTPDIWLPPTIIEGVSLIINFERDLLDTANARVPRPQPFFIQFTRPGLTILEERDTLNGVNNTFYLTWRIGDRYDEHSHSVETSDTSANLIGTWTTAATGVTMISPTGVLVPDHDLETGDVVAVPVAGGGEQFFRLDLSVNGIDASFPVENRNTGSLLAIHRPGHWHWTYHNRPNEVMPTENDRPSPWMPTTIHRDHPHWLEHMQRQETKWSWFRLNEATAEVSEDRMWLPIHYWMTIERDSVAAVLMGSPGNSSENFLSSPAYFGMLQQIEGALATDDRGNFAGFSGSEQAPQQRNEIADMLPANLGNIAILSRFGDYTGTGTTDIIMVSTKSGKPFQGHKVGLFGMYEFKEQTFNAQSAHTGKHAVTDIVVADVHENERGILKNCLGVPKLGKEHGVHLVANRYMAEKEETFIFLEINAPYTPFNTGNDVLIGFALKTND